MGRDRSRSRSRERRGYRDRSRSRSRDRRDRRDRLSHEDYKRSRRESPPPRDRDHRRKFSRSPPLPPSNDVGKNTPAQDKDLPPPPPLPLEAPLQQEEEAMHRPEPLSLEELLKKKRELDEEAAKPKFISKKEREAMAIQRRELEVALSHHRGINGSLRSVTASLGLSASGLLSGSRGGGGGGGAGPSSTLDILSRVRGIASTLNNQGAGGGGDGKGLLMPLPLPSSLRPLAHEDERDRQRGDQRGDRDGRGGGRGGYNDGKAEREREREREKELEMIKQQYLGAKKERRIVKNSEKQKFVFDWNLNEDTSRDLNPLYNKTHEAALLFGRGMRAGIDRKEQKKQGILLEQDLIKKSRAAVGFIESVESRAQDGERSRQAEAYDGMSMRVDVHWSGKALKDMTDRDWRIFREDFNIQFRGNADTLPMRSWAEANIPSSIMQAIDKAGYKKPSPIQMAAIPLGLIGKDVIGVAETGSGKTCAFMVPLLAYILKQPPMDEVNCADGPYSVILAPTRELAQQIEEEAIKLSHFCGFKTIAIVGGQSIEEQGSKLRRGCEIVVATPGRLIDCLSKHYAVLNQCHYIVLDEADRMIDLGFEPQVIGVMEAMPSSNLKPEAEDAVLEQDKVYRTTYMFSATMPPAVERLARKYMRRPVVVNIGRAGQATDNVTQRIIMLKENDKPSRLVQELELLPDKRAIVFVNTKRQCDTVFYQLENKGHRCTVLHGGKTQDQREAGIKGFRDDTYNILIATDVAGRGIDVPDVNLVINYDMPNSIEPYTHRIGRTGRAGKKGIAVTFLTGADTEVYYDLKRLLEESKAAVPPELARHEASKNKPGSVEAMQRKPEIQYSKR